MRRWLGLSGVALLGLGLLAGCPRPGEICNNGLDDDGNGVDDCNDVDCAADPVCRPDRGTDAGVPDGGNHGSCAKCGRPCAAQKECLANSFEADEPLPQCREGVCVALNEGIRINFEVDTVNWAGVSTSPRSMNTRFVLKKALDGSAVTCDVLKAAAPSTLAADADQIERSGRFNLLAYDVAPVNPGAMGTKVRQPFLPAGTGSDFIIWAELWGGPRDSTTHLPTGTRLGKVVGCYETGPEVAPIKTEHHCAQPPTSCRTIGVVMPAPQP